MDKLGFAHLVKIIVTFGRLNDRTAATGSNKTFLSRVWNQMTPLGTNPWQRMDGINCGNNRRSQYVFWTMEEKMKEF